MRDSSNLFKQGIDKAFSKITLNPSTMSDATKYKREFGEDSIKGGLSDNKTFDDLINKYKRKGNPITQLEKELKSQLNMGIKVEMEHTKSKKMATEIAMDHLWEDPKYYSKLKKIETKEEIIKGKFDKGFTNDVTKNLKMNKPIGKLTSIGKSENIEATSSGSSGQYSTVLFSESEEGGETTEATSTASSGAYVTTDIWAKSQSKKDWRGASKPQYKGGKFVKVKKKCKTFPYCNQGDIKALKIFENSLVKNVIKDVSKKFGLNEETILEILMYEFNLTNNKI
jgi:hypothetical protein